MTSALTIEAEILLGISCVSLITLYSYYLYFFTGLNNHSVSNKSDKPVSVIIAARNELHNLKRNLPHILTQNYSIFEVVVINDGSYDGTKDYLKELALTYPKLKIVTVELKEQFQRGKKFALTLGIKAASYEYLLFTDADCKPMTNKWIECMMNHLEDEKEILLGNSPLTVTKNLLGSMVHYETFHTALQYLSYAKKGYPYMGVGRNLAYTKTLFFQNKGFANHQHILSGDDDLFVQEVASNKNTAICIDPDSFTQSEGPKSLGTWFKQKIRHLSTGKLYTTKLKLFLGIYSLAHLLTYACAIAIVALSPSFWYLSVCILISKWSVQWIVMFKPSKHLGYKKIGFALPYYDILYTIYLIIFGFARPFLKPKTWN